MNKTLLFIAVVIAVVALFPATEAQEKNEKQCKEDYECEKEQGKPCCNRKMAWMFPTQKRICTTCGRNQNPKTTTATTAATSSTTTSPEAGSSPTTTAVPETVP